MAYNWQFENWPHFEYDTLAFSKYQVEMMELIGNHDGMQMLMEKEQYSESIVNQMVNEALKTSEIEGEYLSRPDLISSIKHNLGYEAQRYFVKDKRSVGLAKLMVLSKEKYNDPLTFQMLFDWHELLMKGSHGISVGQWRSHSQPMQVVSGPVGKETVHFEAPPSINVVAEMKKFVEWYNQNSNDPNPLVFSAVCHLYFESIHPFEDGNGRIGRVLAEKALSQSMKRPILISLSTIIANNKSNYYSAIKLAQSQLKIDDWIHYFCQVIIDALKWVILQLKFAVAKSKFFASYELNERQTKVVSRMLDESAEFKGGMNASKYMSIAKTSKATATRDLKELVLINALVSKGAGRSTNYQVNIEFGY